MWLQLQPGRPAARRGGREHSETPRITRILRVCCGARGSRTPDLFHAMEARYQLRHSPDSYSLRAGRSAGKPTGSYDRHSQHGLH